MLQTNSKKGRGINVSGDAFICEGLCDFQMNYQENDGVYVENDGKRLMIDYTHNAGNSKYPSTLIHKGEGKYILQKIYINAPSINGIDDTRYACEIQLVHHSHNNERQLIISIMGTALEPGQTKSSITSPVAYAFFRNMSVKFAQTHNGGYNIPKRDSGTSQIMGIDNWSAFDLFPKDHSFVTYAESDRLLRIVLKEPITIPDEFLVAFQKEVLGGASAYNVAFDVPFKGTTDGTTGMPNTPIIFFGKNSDVVWPNNKSNTRELFTNGNTNGSTNGNTTGNTNGNTNGNIEQFLCGGTGATGATACTKSVGKFIAIAISGLVCGILLYLFFGVAFIKYNEITFGNDDAFLESTVTTMTSMTNKKLSTFNRLITRSFAYMFAFNYIETWVYGVIIVAFCIYLMTWTMIYVNNDNIDTAGFFGIVSVISVVIFLIIFGLGLCIAVIRGEDLNPTDNGITSYVYQNLTANKLVAVKEKQTKDMTAIEDETKAKLDAATATAAATTHNASATKSGGGVPIDVPLPLDKIKVEYSKFLETRDTMTLSDRKKRYEELLQQIDAAEKITKKIENLNPTTNANLIEQLKTIKEPDVKTMITKTDELLQENTRELTDLKGELKKIRINNLSQITIPTDKQKIEAIKTNEEVQALIVGAIKRLNTDIKIDTNADTLKQCLHFINNSLIPISSPNAPLNILLSRINDLIARDEQLNKNKTDIMDQNHKLSEEIKQKTNDAIVLKNEKKQLQTEKKAMLDELNKVKPRYRRCADGNKRLDMYLKTCKTDKKKLSVDLRELQKKHSQIIKDNAALEKAFDETVDREIQQYNQINQLEAKLINTTTLTDDEIVDLKRQIHDLVSTTDIAKNEIQQFHAELIKSKLKEAELTEEIAKIVDKIETSSTLPASIDTTGVVASEGVPGTKPTLSLQKDVKGKGENAGSAGSYSNENQNADAATLAAAAVTATTPVAATPVAATPVAAAPAPVAAPTTVTAPTTATTPHIAAVVPAVVPSVATEKKKVIIDENVTILNNYLNNVLKSNTTTVLLKQIINYKGKKNITMKNVIVTSINNHFNRGIKKGTIDTFKTKSQNERNDIINNWIKNVDWNTSKIQETPRNIDIKLSQA